MTEDKIDISVTRRKFWSTSLQFTDKSSYAASKEIAGSVLHMTSLLMNLILNSIDAFKENQTLVSTITIEFKNGVLSVQDNGGGISKKVLERIGRQLFISNRENGNGLGLLFISDEMSKVGGHATFSNTAQGACVQLSFPKKLVVPTTV